MRVVSQSRRYSVDFDRSIFLTQDNIIYAKIGNDNIVFGKYESEERAAEVFEDMHKAYSPYRLIYNIVPVEQIQTSVDLKNFMVPQIEKADIDCTALSDSIVYYMPEVRNVYFEIYNEHVNSHLYVDYIGIFQRIALET